MPESPKVEKYCAKHVVEWQVSKFLHIPLDPAGSSWLRPGRRWLRPCSHHHLRILKRLREHTEHTRGREGSTCVMLGPCFWSKIGCCTLEVCMRQDLLSWTFPWQSGSREDAKVHDSQICWCWRCWWSVRILVRSQSWMQGDCWTLSPSHVLEKRGERPGPVLAEIRCRIQGSEDMMVPVECLMIAISMQLFCAGKHVFFFQQRSTLHGKWQKHLWMAAAFFLSGDCPQAICESHRCTGGSSGHPAGKMNPQTPSSWVTAHLHRASWTAYKPPSK